MGVFRNPLLYYLLRGQRWGHGSFDDRTHLSQEVKAKSEILLCTYNKINTLFLGVPDTTLEEGLEKTFNWLTTHLNVLIPILT